MFESVGWGELSVLLVLALFVVGPERLPALASQAGSRLREARRYFKTMTSELTTELGPELGNLDLRSLHPTDVARRLLDGNDDADDRPAAGP